MKLVLDTCVLKLATLPNPVNPAALIVELGWAERLEFWASPAMIEEYTEVLADHEVFLRRILASLEVCYPLTELQVIRHKPDNRFLECALAISVDLILTVNTAPGHFDRPAYQTVRVATPGAFVNLPAVQRIIRKWPMPL